MKVILFLAVLLMGTGNEPADTLKSRVEKLFETASLWRVGENREKVDSARKELVEIGKPALDYIFSEKIKTTSVLELRAIKHVILKLKEEARPYVYSNIHSENDTIRRNCIWLLGEMKDTTGVDTLLNMLKKEKDFKMIARILIALGKIGDTTATNSIIPYLEHEKEPVRVYATEALGKLRDERAIQKLLDALSDSICTVRYTATWALAEIGTASIEPIVQRMQKTRDLAYLRQCVITLGEIAHRDTLSGDDSLKIRRSLKEFIDSEDWVLRGYAVEVLGLVGDGAMKDILREKLEFESHPFVRRKIEDAIQK